METISARELDRYSGDDGYLIIDLRSREEYMHEHIRGAINVPQGRFRRELAGWERKKIILYCERGALSMAVARELERRGFRTVTVVGGFRAYKEEEMW